MQTIMYIVPACIILFLVIRKTIRIYKDGLFLALLQLGLVAVCAVLAFVLTRLIFNPARVDFLGLGQKLLDFIPEDFFLVMPRMEAFIRALPTALIALLAFSLFFEILRVNCAKLLSKLNKKHGWSEKYLHFKGNKCVALAVGLVTAVLALLIDLVTLNGIVSFSSNMLYCAETATGQAYFGAMGRAVEEFENSPVKRITDAMGCKWAFHALTTAERDGESFSVGQELTDISYTIVGLMPIFDAIPSEDGLPDAEQLRQLPALLTANPESIEMVTALVRASQEDLAQSDAVLVASTVMGVTTEQFADYLDQLTPETTETDLQTFCNIAALMREHDLLPEKGEMISMKDLEDPAFLEQVVQELYKNDGLVEFFGLDVPVADAPAA